MALPRSIIHYLIAINVAIFLLTYALKIQGSEIFALYNPLNPHFGIWQFFTHMFLHGGITHILFNMYALWAFGTPLAKFWGNTRFIMFFLATGIGAGLFYTAIHLYQFTSIYNEILALGHTPEEISVIIKTARSSGLYNAIGKEQLTQFFSLYYTPVVGASGAIYGLLVAFALLYPQAKLALIFIPYPIKAMYFVPCIIAGDLFFIFTPYSLGNVAHVAHVGGAIIGLVIMQIWRFRIKQRLKKV